MNRTAYYAPNQPPQQHYESRDELLPLNVFVRQLAARQQAEERHAFENHVRGHKSLWVGECVLYRWEEGMPLAGRYKNEVIQFCWECWMSRAELHPFRIDAEGNLLYAE